MKYLTKFKDIEVKKGKIYIGIILDKNDMYSGDPGDIYQLTVFANQSPIYDKFNGRKKLYSLEYKKYKDFDTINELIDYLDETGTEYDIKLLKRGLGKGKKKKKHSNNSLTELLMDRLYGSNITVFDSEEISETLLNYFHK